MSKEHNVTYFIIEISLSFSDASNSFCANTRECLLIDKLYISNVLK